MKTYNKTINMGGYLLLDTGTSKEKIISLDTSRGDFVLINKKGITIARRVQKQDNQGRYFVFRKIRYNVKN